jgi:hypothetical protein
MVPGIGANAEYSRAARPAAHRESHAAEPVTRRAARDLVGSTCFRPIIGDGVPSKGKIQNNFFK